MMGEKEDFFFMVYVEGEHTPAYKHSDLTSAETEAKRLAESLNRKAYVLCSIKSFEVNKFMVRDCRPTLGDDLPF
ncbi:hypothetical protein [Bacteroides xylanisolvens]|uniref:hypothetical protein n=1 Tax=Bacteroides xylanisolvens TaxID=371601 RepID=UPI00216B658C|nr:hypothetical protein [Bacteroides xylanisolvens]